jgi:hypothetical protein
MNAPPKITAIDEVPDRHAERVVWEMLQYLHAGQTERWARAKGAIRTSQMGSVVGQQRAVARFTETVGDLALRVELNPAKRGRYLLRVISWIAYNPLTDACVLPGEPLPPQAQLGVIISFGSGRNHRPVWDSGMPLVISRHAMARLAQRANVRTINDLLLSVRELWDAAEGLLMRMVCTGLENARRANTHISMPDIIDADGDAWFEAIPAEGLRLPLSNDCVAVVAHADAGKRLLIVRTVLGAGMLNEED